MFPSVAESTKSTSNERSNLNASRGNWQKLFYFHSPEFQFTGTDGLDPGYCHTGIVWFTIEGNQISRWNVKALGLILHLPLGNSPQTSLKKKWLRCWSPSQLPCSKSRVTPCSSLGHRQRQTSILDSGLHLLNHILESTISPMCMFGVWEEAGIPGERKLHLLAVRQQYRPLHNHVNASQRKNKTSFLAGYHKSLHLKTTQTEAFQDGCARTSNNQAALQSKASRVSHTLTTLKENRFHSGFIFIFCNKVSQAKDSYYRVINVCKNEIIQISHSEALKRLTAHFFFLWKVCLRGKEAACSSSLKWQTASRES